MEYIVDYENPNKKISGCPQLHIVLLVENNYEVAQKLLDNGADINMLSDDGYNIIMDTCKPNNMELLKFLVERGCDVNAKYKSTGLSILNCSMINDNLEMFNYLIDNGADINVKDIFGNTLLVNTIQKVNKNKDKYEKYINILLEKGVDTSGVELNTSGYIYTNYNTTGISNIIKKLKNNSEKALTELKNANEELMSINKKNKLI